MGYYATSLSLPQYDEAALQEMIRDHWSAIENGTYYRRDVTLGEDAWWTANHPKAEVLASLRNLANSLYYSWSGRGNAPKWTRSNPGASNRPFRQPGGSCAGEQPSP